MKLTKNKCLSAGRWIGLWLMGMALVSMANGQAISTTTVQGTVYLANGQPGAGTLDVSWPAFTTANNQAVTAGRITVTIAPDGFMSVNLAPNMGAMPAGLYYTAVYHMTDGTTSTEYWVVPAGAQAALGSVRAQVMPATQAVQAVNKAYVDQSIAQSLSLGIAATGGTINGPLTLSGDPTQALQAADKHYVDASFGKAVPLAGGNMTGPLETPAVNGVQAPAAGSTLATLQAAISAAGTNGAVEIPPTYAGTDGFTNPNGVYVRDLRQTSSQQFERSVKEFGAVCDGSTDDTNALQAALNYAQTHGVALTIPQGTCKTHTLTWHGESIGGLGKQVSALMGFPGQDVLATATDSTSLLSYTRLHDLTIYADQSQDVSCSTADGRAPAGSCAVNRQLEGNTIFSPGGNGLTGTTGTGAAWAVGNCAIAMPAVTGAGGNGLRVAEIENLEIVATGVDPMAQYTGAHSTHTCGLYLAQWPQWSEFRNIDIRGLNTGIAMPALQGTAPEGLNADSNRWQNITIQATHGFTAAAGSNNVLDDVVVVAGNSAATGEPPTGLVLDLGNRQTGWTVRNAVVLPAWNAVQPQLTVAASGGAITGVTAGPEHGLGFDPYGMQVPLKFDGICTAQATANVNNDGSIGNITVTNGGNGCSATTTASVNVQGTWDTAAPVNLISGQSVTLFGGNLLKGNGGYTVWNAAGSQSYGTQLGGGGGTLPGGGTYSALVANTALGSVYQVDQFPGTDFGAKLQACVGSLSAINGGTCDARNFTGTVSMGSNVTISTANATVLLPCATISTANQIVVTAGTRNVALRGCALRGTSGASGSQGGTVFLYSGTGAAVQVGDATYALDTQGFHLDNVAINTTGATATGKGLAAYRTQEMDLESLYFLGNSNQTGVVLDGTGNYTGGTFFDNALTGFQSALSAIGHQVPNPAPTDWLNASTFVRLHINCPTSGGSPISGTYGINLQQGDGNTFTGGDVEGCDTALHLGANAQNNTIVGLRNENSNNQVVADAGSSYNNWMTGGTMFTGQLTDNGTRNSFLDTFHRSFNGMNGDWYGSQKDATVTNHFRLGTGTGNERGLLDRYQTDYGYRWTTGLSDATAGEQFYQVLDELNNVYRLSIGQYNNGQASTNNQTVVNAAGTGAVVLNGSNNSGTGGVIFGSGGPSETTVATINNAGNALFNGSLQVGGTSTFTGTTTVKNQANAEIDSILQAGSTASQKESFIYKDWNGNSQWYMVKDANNNWALNSATGGLDSFKAYQNTNSGDTYINTANSSGVIRLNYETGSSGKTYIYGGNSSSLVAAFSGTTAIAFPGLAASSGRNCLQIDNSGYISNTGSGCGTSSSSGSGTVNIGNTGQIAYYSSNGPAVSGMAAVPVSAGGTGATTPAGALTALGAQASIPGLSGDAQSMPGIQVAGTVAAGAVSARNMASIGPRYDVIQFGAVGNYLSTTTGTISSGSFTLTVGSGSLFVIGQGISIAGADAGSGTLVSKITAISGNTITLQDAATNSVTGATVSPDDSVAIQAAFDTCWNNRTLPNGGIVEFPGVRTYVISRTINAHDGCKIEGINQSASGNAGPVAIYFQNAPAQGTVYSVTGFTVAHNTSPYIYAASSTAPFPHLNAITLTAANSLSPNQWVLLNGCTTYTGLSINNIVAQVASASSTSFTVVTSATPNTFGTFTDNCTATVANVGIAFDANARYGQVVKGIMLTSNSHLPAANGLGVGLMFGSRVDTDTELFGSWIDGAQWFDYYFAAGGINISFDQGWRSDGVGVAAIYWRVEGSSNLSIGTGEFNNASVGTMEGGGIMLDNQGCQGASVQLNIHNVIFEADSNDDAGTGSVMMLDCTYPNLIQPQFRLDLENVIFGVSGNYYSPEFVMYPPNDRALSLTMANTVAGTSPVTQQRFIGLPALSRYDKTGSAGIFPFFTYNPSLLSGGFTSGAASSYVALAQLPSDVNIGQLWQYGVQASALLYSDTGYAALPNATTLYPGQILAPPAYWYKANGKRYALDVVYQAGTTGSPNAGATTCMTEWPVTAYSISNNVITVYSSNNLVRYAAVKLNNFATSTFLNNQALTLASNGNTNTQFTAPFTHADVPYTVESGTVDLNYGYICTSPTDLSVGQWIKVGSDAGTEISVIDDAYPSQTYIKTTSNNGVNASPSAMAFLAPVLGPEMQLSTKSAAVPTSLAWSQGDVEWNSGAVANGVAGWVNVAGGTPGTWAGIPLGDSNGAISPAQLNGTLSPAQMGAGTPGPGQYVDGGSGAWTPLPAATAATSVPGWLTFLGTGADGALTPTNGQILSGEYWVTSFTLNSGVSVKVTTISNDLVVHSKGACTINGAILANGATNGWPYSNKGLGGGSSGGSGGGTAVGTAGAASYSNAGNYTGNFPGGTAGTASGGAGGNGSALSVSLQRVMVGSNSVLDGAYFTGAAGQAGANSGGTGGGAGAGVTLICQSISGTGVIDVSGNPGVPPAANSTGAGSGGGGGVAVLSSRLPVTNWPTIYTGGGAGGQTSVPYAVPGGSTTTASGNSCTTQPKLSLGVVSGALSSCTVVVAGAGCGSSPTVNWTVLGGGGAGGMVTATWNAGAVASCTATGGTGYTAATYTSAGAGGDGGAGWYTEFQNW